MGERDPSCAAVASPVFGPDGEACGAISLSGPKERFSPPPSRKCPSWSRKVPPRRPRPWADAGHPDAAPGAGCPETAGPAPAAAVARHVSRTPMKPLHELINHEESALPLVQSWAAGAKTACEVLPPSGTLRRRAASPAGHHPLAHGRGRPRHGRPAHRWRPAARAGIGTPRLTRDIASWNAGRSNGFLLIADDAVGGFFAINGGGLRGRGRPVLPGARHPGMGTAGTELHRLPALGAGRRTGGVLRRAALARLADRCAGPGGDQGFSFYPFLWTREGSPSTSSRKAVDVAELYASGQAGG